MENISENKKEISYSNNVCNLRWNSHEAKTRLVRVYNINEREWFSDSRFGKLAGITKGSSTFLYKKKLLIEINNNALKKKLNKFEGGKRSYLNAGFVYAPYVPAQITPQTINEHNTGGTAKVKSRYLDIQVNTNYYGSVDVESLRGLEESDNKIKTKRDYPSTKVKRRNYPRTDNKELYQKKHTKIREVYYQQMHTPFITLEQRNITPEEQAALGRVRDMDLENQGEITLEELERINNR